MELWYVWFMPADCQLAGVFSTEKKAIEYQQKKIAVGWDEKDWSIDRGTIDVPLMPIAAPVGHN